MGEFIENVRAVFPEQCIAATNIRFANGRVAAIDAATPEPEDRVVQGDGRLLTPGLVDVHVHGILRYNFDNGPDDLLAAARYFPQFAVEVKV